jgi:hypothetical protein
MVTRGFIARYKQVEGAKCQEKLVKVALFGEQLYCT